MSNNIAIIINSLRRGGAEKILASLINELHKDMEIHLFMFNTRQIEFDIPDGIFINQLGKSTSASARAVDVLKLPFYAWKIKRYLDKNKIPLVFSFLNRPNFIAGYLKVFGYKGKTIINERTNTSYYYTRKTLGGRLGMFLVKRLYAKADCIITNSAYSKKDLEENTRLTNRIITIRNGINFEYIQQLLAKSSPPFEKKAGEFIFCHVGRFHPDKNQAMLVEAFAAIKTPATRLMMLGKNIPAGLSPLVNKLGIADKVILEDLQKDPWCYYAIADAFVLSSNVEGFPNVILEAMACGLPVISTDCKWGPREILAPGTSYPEGELQMPEYAKNGILVAGNNSRMLSTAMLELRENPSIFEKYRKQSEQICASFNETAAIEQFISCISQYLPLTR
jgi:N-acetylgalactosamine-N,N'-diacetylbacillosaminyl-diphospho-undecaprenol 4-alpha-N-acetylgalactosaminyltransferase